MNGLRRIIAGGKGSPRGRGISVAFVVAVCAVLVASQAIALVIDTTSPNFYAWGENIGWLNWGSSQGNVVVPDSSTDGELTGYVWGENVGWISLNCSNTSSCGTVDFKVERDQGNVRGYAWGENIGWLSFNCSNTSSCGTVNYGVSIATSSGEFSGYAWGENVGWVVFNCSTTSSCGTVDYRVQTSVSPTATATPTPTPSGGGGGIISTTPPPTATPTGPPASVTPAPTVLPTPTTTTTPSASPPPATPTTSPTTSPPPDEPTDIIDVIGDGLDGITDIIRDLVADRPVEAGAVATTVAALIPVLLAAIQALQTQTVTAVSYSFFQAVGLKKKARVWGVVYDSVTKHPIPHARVQILDEASRVLETRFADRDGRYGFLLSTPSLHEPVRRIRLKADREGYRFPSTTVSVGEDFFVYERPYFGDTIEISADSLLNFDIPVDPVVALSSPARKPYGAVISSALNHVMNVGFYAGLVLVPWNLIRDPNAWNVGIAILFFGANLIRLFVIWRPYGRIRDVATGQAMPFALVTLHDDSGKRIAFSVSDEQGRYFLSAERGRNYTLNVRTPANMAPGRSASMQIASGSRTLRRGWVTIDLKV